MLMLPDMRQGKGQVTANWSSKEARTRDKKHKFGKVPPLSPHNQNGEGAFDSVHVRITRKQIETTERTEIAERNSGGPIQSRLCGLRALGGFDPLLLHPDQHQDPMLEIAAPSGAIPVK
jgi:hypothetical protein